MCAHRGERDARELFGLEGGMNDWLRRCRSLQAMQEAVRLPEWIIREIANAGRQQPRRQCW